MLQPEYRVVFGFDANEMVACNVAMSSMLARTSRGDVRADRISRLSLQGLYTRPTTRMPSGQLFDEISGAPMSTDHALARFWIPYLAGYHGHVCFVDGDTLFREDVRQLFALADPQYAVQVVEHPPLLEEGEKKSGHVQQAYPRKNQSSVMLLNCGHTANRALTLDVLNAWPGRDLHAFRWLKDNEIGTLPARWNYLVNVSAYQADPALVHFTLGCPDVKGHEHDQFADEWYAVAKMAGYELPERQAT